MTEGSPHFEPRIDVTLTDDGATARVQLPGVAQEEIEIQTVGERVNIRGVKRAAFAVDEHLVQRESASGRFSRIIRLPFIIDAARATAVLRDGVLIITLPQAKVPRRAVQEY